MWSDLAARKYDDDPVEVEPDPVWDIDIIPGIERLLTCAGCGTTIWPMGELIVVTVDSRPAMAVCSAHCGLAIRDDKKPPVVEAVKQFESIYYKDDDNG